MASEIIVTNIHSGDIVFDDVAIQTNSTYSVDRNRFVVPLWGTEESVAGAAGMTAGHILSDLQALVVDGKVTATYGGALLSASDLANLDNIDSGNDDEVSMPFDDGGALLTIDVYWTAPKNCVVTGFRHMDIVGITANAANYATFTLVNETTTLNVALGTTDLVANGGMGTIAQWGSYSIPLTAYTAVTEGDVLHFALTKAAAGVLCQGEVKVLYKTTN